MSLTAALAEQGYTIEPFEELDNGRFVLARRVGSLVYTSGQVSSWEGREIKGRVGSDLTLEEGSAAARFCALNCLRAIRTVVPSLDEVHQFVKVLGMVNVAPGFDDTTRVIDGCSVFLRETFGDLGSHARSAVGMTLPYNWAVEIEMIVEIAG
jgi:enamine deaminase RidA (YjgF/YER057c/UK114 family)